MTDAILLRPGRASLADWRAVYRGAPITLDPVSRADVEAGSAALELIAANSGASGAEAGSAGPAMVELLHKDGAYLPAAIVRLFVALKLASLAQGMSGVRWALIGGLVDCLARDVLPAIPNSNATDRLALSHLFGALTGAGEVLAENRGPAARARKKAGLAPLKLNGDERSALLSGTQLSTALALAGLFEAERVLQSALVAAAMSNAATEEPDPLAHPRVYKLRRHPGQIEVAAALRELLSGSASAAAAAAPSARDAARIYGEMGAVLDLLRQAGATLERSANAVSEERLILWQSGEIVSAVDDTAPVSFAADLIAVALRQIASLLEPRSAQPLDPAVPAGDADATADASPAAVNGRGFGSPGAATGDVRKLLPMAGSASLVVAIAFLTAARAGDEQPAEGRAAALDKVRDLLRSRIPQGGEEEGIPATHLAVAAELVRSGALAGAAGVELPSVVQPRSEPPSRRLGARGNRK